jgi:hypothetical protein
LLRQARAENQQLLLEGEVLRRFPMKLVVNYPKGALQLRTAGLAAAMAVFGAADVDPFNAWLACGAYETWGDSGFDEQHRLAPDQRRALIVLAEAQIAAQLAMGLPNDAVLMPS